MVQTADFETSPSYTDCETLLKVNARYARYAAHFCLKFNFTQYFVLMQYCLACDRN